jgi:hypothetical protein
MEIEVQNKIKINLNDHVYVKLKDEAILKWVDHYNQEWLPKKHHVSFTELRARRDKDGFHKFQLWHFINIFSSQIEFGRPSTFESNNIYFDLKQTA